MRTPILSAVLVFLACFSSVTTGFAQSGSPSSVVKEYYSCLGRGDNASSLLSTKSKEFYSSMGDDLAIVQTAIARVDAKNCNWTVGSEKSEGDKAWVTVVVETDDPAKAYLERMEAEIKAKNAYNRKTGQTDLIAVNNAYLEEKKQQLATPIGKQLAEMMRRVEVAVLCLRENGTWKVAPIEQVDQVLENLNKMMEDNK